MSDPCCIAEKLPVLFVERTASPSNTPRASSRLPTASTLETGWDRVAVPARHSASPPTSVTTPVAVPFTSCSTRRRPAPLREGAASHVRRGSAKLRLPLLLEITSSSIAASWPHERHSRSLLTVSERGPRRLLLDEPSGPCPRSLPAGTVFPLGSHLRTPTTRCLDMDRTCCCQGRAARLRPAHSAAPIALQLSHLEPRAS